MVFEFRLPDIGEGVIEGEIVRWLIKEGDVLREDQPMVEVMTDKATVEIPAPKAGRVTKLNVAEGKMCAVGQVMLVIDTGSGAIPSTAKEERQFIDQLPTATSGNEKRVDVSASPLPGDEKRAARSVPPLPGDEKRAAGSVPPLPLGEGRGEGAGASATKPLATPATRKLARDLGVDLQGVRGTGESGRVLRDDVLAAAGKPAEPVRATGDIRPAEPIRASEAGHVSPSTDVSHLVRSSVGDERIPFRGVRRKIAENMARSRRAAAHFTYVDEADVTELVQLRERARKRVEERGARLSFLPFIIKAVVAGLKKYPIVNSTLDEEKSEIVLRKSYHIGVAAASEAGLIVPVVRDADKKSLFEIAVELGELSEKARQGKASREELTGSTFTISSLGALGGVLATPIINYPEVAILGVHKIKQSPVVRDGQIVIREMTNFSISLDHRVVDGYEGALFLQHVIGLLSDPTLMFLELV